ncbi:MAG: hypothetical protein GWP14_04115 [Actinobacteria bacterium]|nr:hypothetical protein [Actinomycetota bacterium]
MGFMEWMDKEARKDRKHLDKAFKNKKVREFLKQENLGFDDLKEAYRRIRMLGIRKSGKKKALVDITTVPLTCNGSLVSRINIKGCENK